MAGATLSAAAWATARDLIEALGAIDPGRVRLDPLPGTATEADLIRLNDQRTGLFELVDGVLVEKTMGLLESCLAGAIIAILREFILRNNLGIVTAPVGMMRMAPATIRAPDVAFVAWGRILGGRISRESLADVVPDLAIEVLCPSNTKAEMARKRRGYFEAGVRLVWEIDPEARTVAVYEEPERATLLGLAQTLNGGEVLPGFALLLADLFADLDRQGA